MTKDTEISCHICMSRWWMALPYLFGQRHEVGWRCRLVDPSATKKRREVSFGQVVPFSSPIWTSYSSVLEELLSLSWRIASLWILVSTWWDHPVSVRIRIEHYWTSVCCSLLCFDTLDAGQASIRRGPSVANGEESDTTVRKQKDSPFHDDLRDVRQQRAPRQDNFVS